MRENLLSLLCGVLFGLGLSLSGMTNPNNVIQFLDITGDWNPSLLAVLISAVITTFVSFHLILRRKQPVCDSTFHLPQKTAIDKPLVIGAAIFGIGWGMTGYCPGAAIAALITGNTEVVVFCLAMLVGMYIAKKIKI